MSTIVLSARRAPICRMGMGGRTWCGKRVRNGVTYAMGDRFNCEGCLARAAAFARRARLTRRSAG